MSESYIDIKTWLASIWHHNDAGHNTSFFHQYSCEKFAIASRFVPQRIAEIGVRLGYSAHAFVMASKPDACFFGFDIVNGGWGGTNVAGLEYAESILHRDFPLVTVKMTKTDTQKLTELGITAIDFFHVDGDHSFKGAKHDMELAWKTIRSGGVMVIDDYDFVHNVKLAVDEFCSEHASEITLKEYVKTCRGDVVVVKA